MYKLYLVTVKCTPWNSPKGNLSYGQIRFDCITSGPDKTSARTFVEDHFRRTHPAYSSVAASIDEVIDPVLIFGEPVRVMA